MQLDHYRLLGRSGLRVSPIALGTMTFGPDWGWGADASESRKQLDLYAERGGNFIDTANFYTEGTSEKFLGEFLQGQRDRFVVATKYTLNLRDGDPNGGGNHRKSLVQNVNASLQRLQTDYIDLLWVHMDDGITPLEETMRALDDVVRQGKVLYVGISDMPAWRVARANTLAEWRGWSPFIGLQVEYSLAERTVERELIPMARELGLGVTPWSPLAQGVLSGRYTQADLASSAPTSGGTSEGRHERNKTNGRLNARTLAIANEAKAIAEELGATTVQVALRWLLEQPGVTSPIIGARTAAQLEDSLGCFGVNLAPEHYARLNAVSAIELGFPQSFLSQDYVKKFMSGGTTILP
ncbi:aldo/keto reductase [Armatimonas rosea]|uniref:Aryl-alcohol dehydrogenase-like predicted oxidoreductase n=1 Tax=Armatimonas rosea TaxID=685828 RepID=A0A7W9W4B7_ARMRO|nr:aldo/keto reductase [Armatimonas rosea]MBB6048348.1 aryl-alcohol dehydrogenase-like predicted oxidoreductase [Armatimonas rosea]